MPRKKTQVKKTTKPVKKEASVKKVKPGRTRTAGASSHPKG
jgi:hypothetical protein